MKQKLSSPTSNSSPLHPLAAAALAVTIFVVDAFTRLDMAVAVLDAHLPSHDFGLARPAPDGPKRYASVSGLPVFDDEGRTVFQFCLPAGQGIHEVS